VEDYHKKIEITMIIANIVKDKETTMTSFLNGLNKELENMVELQNNSKLEDMIHMATKIER
jgi:hypothetical protein